MTDIPQQQLPEDALRRLRESEIPGGRRLFTSDLTVNEFLLVEEAGFTPLGLVMGSSIYQIGLQTRKWSQSTELDKLTQAMYTARELAMTRMEEEADVLGADGIVGVRLDVNYYEWGKSTAEFIAVGKPFTSDLSGQDFWTLLHAGYAPLGLVLGTCVYHVAHRTLLGTMGAAGRATELPNFTQALYDARERAMTRMEEEATRLQADGIVGVQLVEKSHMWGSHTIEFLAIGTGVRSISDDHVVPPPVPVITMDR